MSSLDHQTSALEAPASSTRPAPTTLAQIARHLGPGLIVTASIVGSGELIVTPKLGADVGFILLWFIILGCLIKVFVQIELGRFAVARGMTTLQALDLIPGPRFVVSWLLWLWLLMFVCLVFQVAGIMAGVAAIFPLLHIGGGDRFWVAMVALACAVPLVLGRYRLVESASAVMVGLFTLLTVLAVGALYWTPFRPTAASLVEGFSFHLPANFTTAFAAFGIIGVGASELIYYPYWCLEKGYAQAVGPKEHDPRWFDRARGWLRVMSYDAWLSFAVYTLATIAFYVLGAAVLHGKSLQVTNDEMIPTLSHMYRETFGAAGFALFLFGAFMVLFSTAFVATASNARLFADALTVFKVVRYRSGEDRQKVVKAGCVLLPLISLGLFWFWGKPVTLVFVGALAQGLILPFLAVAALYLRFRHTDAQLRPGKIWTTLLGLSTACMIAIGVYQVADQILRVRQPASAQATQPASSNSPTSAPAP